VRRGWEYINSPEFLRVFAGAQVILWLALIPISGLFGWISDVGFVSYLSEIALVLAAWSWWQAARVEVRQDQDADVAEVLALLREHIEESRR
jgi:hypothetical protein